MSLFMAILAVRKGNNMSDSEPEIKRNFLGTDVWVMLRDTALKTLRALEADRYLAEDLAQEAVAKYMEHVDRNGVPEKPEQYIKQIARNLHKDHGRLLDKENREDQQREDDSNPGEEALLRVFSSAAMTSQIAGLKDILNQVKAALNDKEFAILVADAEGLSQAEIAVELGYKSAATVATTLSRARAKVADIIKDYYGSGYDKNAGRFN